MKKIPTLFKRDFSKPNRPLTPEYNTGTEWVIAGEGIPTRKYDGQAVLIRDGHMYKRYEYKDEASKTPPTDFEEVDYDSETGKHFGWVQVGWGSEDKWFREAIIEGDNPDDTHFPDGTYELLGPKVQGNPERTSKHFLQKHDHAQEYDPKEIPLDFDGLREWLSDKDIEGIVWHHPDGRMVKIKKKDYRLKR